MERKSFKEGFLSDLKSRCSIVTEASRYIELKRQGRTFWGRCPFHFEKTASFAIDEARGFYHCFGCGESGDVIELIKQTESTDFLGAVEILAQRAGMEMQFSQEDTQNISRILKQKRELYTILKDATEFYQAELLKPTSKIAQDYIKKRKINKNSLNSFMIGYSPNFNAVVDYLKTKNHSLEMIYESGVSGKNDDGKYYDAYAKRLIFPIQDNVGNIIGFSGRQLEENKELAKYKNTRQTLVFDKSKAIYGIRQAIVSRKENRFDNVLLVEGQIDVISLHQAGFTNAVATQGTALTKEHGYQLRKVADKVVICYDGDGAGIKATMRAIEILSTLDMEVRVASLPLGVDPDEFITKFGKEKFEELLKNAEGYIDYKLRVLAENVNMNENLDKTKYINESMAILSGLATTAEAEVYLPVVRNYTQVPIEMLRSTLLSQMTGKPSKSTVANEMQDVGVAGNKYSKSEKIILANLIHKKVPYTDELFNRISFENQTFNRIFDIIKQKRDNFELDDIWENFEKTEIQDNPKIAEIMGYEFYDEKINEQMFNESLVINEIKLLEKQVEKLNKEYEENDNIGKRKDIANDLMRVQKALRDKNARLKSLMDIHF